MADQTQQKRAFVTGGSGYVGSVVTEHAIAEGYRVYALSRTETSDKAISELGAEPVRGDLSSLDVLRDQSSKADVVFHIASAYGFGLTEFETPKRIDMAAVKAIADGLEGTNKPLVITSGTLAVTPDPNGVETDETSPLADSASLISSRLEVEAYGIGLASRSIRVTGIRLAPYVYGRGGSGVKLFMGMSLKSGAITYVDGGKNHTTIVHVDDAAKLYLLAAQKGKAGELFNGSSATDVTVGQIFGAMAEILGMPVRDLAHDDAKAQLGDTLAWFLSAENRASGAKARRDLGWEPKEVGILEDIRQGSYLAVAKGLRQQSG
ncbi:hypothetical protein G7Y79_00002g008380 [Physcia stellaris]|nr:hypothetical protein G7Y79_00002g008380 [Physcia stellaris]